MQGQNQFELKGQARRLRTALKELGSPVTHAVALNLVARVHGQRNWETMQAGLAEQAEQAQHAKGSRNAWLLWLQASLLMQGYVEEHLDMLVHDAMASDRASDTNNAGMLSQLDALLTYHEEGGSSMPRQHLLQQLVEELPTFVAPLPESTRQNEEPFIETRVSVCAGSPQERYEVLDALEWFAAASEEDVNKLLEAGLHNTDRSDEVALWLRNHSQDAEVRSKLEALSSWCRQCQHLDEELVGLTVTINEDSAEEFVTYVLRRE